MFEGWPDEALEFFEALEAENTRTFWQAHKATYQRAVLAPMQALLADLAPAWGEGSVMRPNRDIRFSADKSPYRTFIAARIGPGYVQLNARGFGAGCGVWEVARDQLERYRQAVADDDAGAALSSIVDTLAEAGIDIARRRRSTPGWSGTWARRRCLPAGEALTQSGATDARVVSRIAWAPSRIAWRCSSERKLSA